MIRYGVECHQAQPQEMEIVLYLDLMLYWFNSHFAVQPLLPGMAQLDWVMRYTTALLAPDWHFRSIQNVKFLAPLILGTTVTLQLTWQETSQVLTFYYQCHDDDARHTASSGKIRPCRQTFLPAC